MFWRKFRFTLFGKYDDHLKQIQFKAKEVIASIPLPHLLLTLVDNVPEWEYHFLEVNSTINNLIIKKNGKSTCDARLNERVLDDFNDYLRIYTDGSKAEEVTGCAFYVGYCIGVGTDSQSCWSLKIWEGW